MKLEDTPNGLCEIGCQLLRDSLEQMKASHDFETVEYHLYSGKPAVFEAYQQIFESQGFHIEQEKKSFAASSLNCINTPKKLSFKTLQEIGENEFIKAIEQVSAGTLDQDDLNSIKMLGPEEAAKQYFDILKEIDFNPYWWQVAYNDNNEFVGLVVPQKFDETSGAINYIGVVPEQRGKGYVDALLAHGTQRLLDEKLEEIIADIDIQNVPLEKALMRLGYAYERSMLVLKLKL